LTAALTAVHSIGITSKFSVLLSDGGSLAVMGKCWSLEEVWQISGSAGRFEEVWQDEEMLFV